MASRGRHPYNRPQGIRVQCISTSTSRRGTAFEVADGKIKVSAETITTMYALWDGSSMYTSPQSANKYEFQEGCHYVLKNHAISSIPGRKRLFVNTNTKLFKGSSTTISEEFQKLGDEALVPPSKLFTGTEPEMYSSGEYVTLTGVIEKLHVVRMVSGNVPVLDLTLKCGSKSIAMSLWRDEALADLQIETDVTITHLRPAKKGEEKLNSSTYTTIKVLDAKPVSEEIQVIGVSEVQDGLQLVAEDFQECFSFSHQRSAHVNVRPCPKWLLLNCR
nr:uncharacterized protein LOC129446060 [Misgurnus anguillicaudatus]